MASDSRDSNGQLKHNMARTQPLISFTLSQLLLHLNNNCYHSSDPKLCSHPLYFLIPHTCIQYSKTWQLVRSWNVNSNSQLSIFHLFKKLPSSSKLHFFLYINYNHFFLTHLHVLILCFNSPQLPTVIKDIILTSGDGIHMCKKSLIYTLRFFSFCFMWIFNSISKNSENTNMLQFISCPYSKLFSGKIWHSECSISSLLHVQSSPPTSFVNFLSLPHPVHTGLLNIFWMH